MKHDNQVSENQASADKFFLMTLFACVGIALMVAGVSGVWYGNTLWGFLGVASGLSVIVIAALRSLRYLRKSSLAREHFAYMLEWDIADLINRFLR